MLRYRLERWLRNWGIFLLIMLAGLLAGLATWLATSAHPACRPAVSHLPGKPHFTLACGGRE